MDDDGLLDRATEVEGYKVLPPCVLYAKIGQGGMGAVYRGRHLNLDIDVAVKCLKPGLVGDDDQFVVRFRREARSAAQINHQNVIRVYDVAEDRGLHYLIMELVQGETARERVARKGPLKVGEALEILYGAAMGLGEAHRRGFIHRDVKPDNILISSTGQVKVADLGLAKPSVRDENVSLLSGTNLVMGTPQYMPPEQWENTATVTAAADVWALGATLYFLLVGGEAIQKDSLPSIMRRVMFQPFPDPRVGRPDVPDDVAALLAKATSKAPEDRFRDAQELAEAIAQLSTRRASLRDSSAGTTTAQQTLLSPPPAKTLAKIKVWLEDHGGKAPSTQPAPRRSPAPATATQVAPATTAAPGQAGDAGRTEPLQPASAWRPWGVAVALLALLAGGAGYAAATGYWNRPAASADLFATADGLERNGQYAAAIDEVRRVHGAHPALGGRDERLARLHAAWAGELAQQSDYAPALAQFATSLGLRREATVLRRQAELLERIAAAVGAALQRTAPSSPVPRGAPVEFVGRCDHALVVDLRLGGQLAERGADGSFAVTRDLGGQSAVAVEATLVGGQTVVLPPWSVTYAPADAEAVVRMPLPEVALEVPAELVLDDDKAARLSIRTPRGTSLRIDGQPVARGVDEEVHVHLVRSEDEVPAALQVVATKDGCAETTRVVPLRRPPRALGFVKAPVAVPGTVIAVGDRLVTGQPALRVQGQLNEPASELLANGVRVADLQWRDDGWFSCRVGLAEGRNELRLEAKQRFRQPTAELLVVYLLTAEPALEVEGNATAPVQTAAAVHTVVARTDEWTTRVLARVATRSVVLGEQEGTEGRFTGDVALDVGENRIVVEATNVVGRTSRRELRVVRSAPTKRPTIDALVLVAGDQSRPVVKDQINHLRGGWSLQVTASSPGTVLLVNKQPVATATPGLLPLAAYLEEGKPVPLEVAVQNEAGTSEPVKFFPMLDETAPTIDEMLPKEPVPAGKDFVCRGRWSDVGGLASVTVDGKPARLTPGNGVAKKGEWEVRLPVPAEATEYAVVVQDRAGNQTTATLRIELRLP